MGEGTVSGNMVWGRSAAGDEDAYRGLASAVVMQAVKDYTAIIQRMWRPDINLSAKRELLREKLELELFFHSDWYEMLTDVVPESLMHRCRELALEKEKDRIRQQNKKKIQRLKKAQMKTGGEG